MKLSLNETWKHCLAMWKGVVDILELAAECGEDISAHLAKQIWLQQNGYTEDICNKCFFCDYNVNSAEWISDPYISGGCPGCPGTKVDPNFACGVDEYHWLEKPKEFYQELLRLNKKRKENKK